MKLDFLASKGDSFEVFFKESLSEAKSLDWAVAYGSQSAFNLLKDDFNSFFKRGGSSRVVFDLYSGITDPEIVEELITYPGYSKCKVFVGDPSVEGIFHHKFYVFNFEELVKIYLGSSNFTKSALRKNLESGFLATIPHDSDLNLKVNKYYEDNIWNLRGVVSPANDEEILKLYKDVYSFRKKSETEKNKKLSKLSKKIEEVYSNSINFEKVNSDTAYLLGLLCASTSDLTHENVKNRTCNIVFRSQLRSREGEIDHGLICARVGGELLGDVRLPQIKTEISTMKFIKNEIKSLLALDSDENRISFEDKTKNQINVRITINFSEKSKVWKILSSTIDQFDLKNNKFIPNVPKEISESSDTNIKKKFLRGYFDLRGRVSTGDNYPNGKLRLATGIGTYHLNYARQLKVLLDDTLGIKAQIVDGTVRRGGKKDNMIRFDPTEKSLELFDTGWKRILVGEFIKYNNDHF